jgi:hypothetical protein
MAIALSGPAHVRYVAGMSLRLFLLAVSALLVFNGCKSNKGSAAITKGNASNIHFIDQEDAGGPIRSQRYR